MMDCGQIEMRVYFWYNVSAMNDRSRFVVVEGITGSGKSTCLRAIHAYLVDQGLRVFDAQAFAEESHDPPHFDSHGDFDVYFTFEPTKWWVGHAIRKEMSFGDTYSGLEQAHAFSLDRLIQYRRFILPALRAGKTVIQDRCVSSSLLYQPIIAGGPHQDAVAALPGNALALKHAPGHLIVLDLDAKKACERLQGRFDESKGVFEQLELLQNIDKRIRSDWFRDLFTSRGTTIHALDADGTPDIVAQRSIELIQSIIPDLCPQKNSSPLDSSLTRRGTTTVQSSQT